MAAVFGLAVHTSSVLRWVGFVVCQWCHEVLTVWWRMVEGVCEDLG